MNYNKLEQIVSKPRLKRYKVACYGDKQKAIKLYSLNVVLSQSFYPYLSMFEIAFRNAIDKEMRAFFDNSSWLITENRPNGFASVLASNGERYMQQTINQIFRTYNNSATHLNIMSEASLGFWTRFFKRSYFRLLRGRPIQIFRNAAIQVQRAEVYVMLQNIRRLRNRIYHNEPICFLRRAINVTEVETLCLNLNKIMQWLNEDINQFIQGNETHQNIIHQIKQLQEN